MPPEVTEIGEKKFQRRFLSINDKLEIIFFKVCIKTTSYNS